MSPRVRESATARAGLVLAALVAAALAVLAGALTGVPADAAPGRPARPATPAFPPKRPTRVLILGDSVMAGATARYAADLPGRDVTVDAMVNRSTRQGAEVVAQRGADWDVVVILLAHNDGGSPGAYQPAARAILDQLAGVPRVVWLTLHEVRPYYRDVNAFLRDEATRRPNFRVADWNALVSQHPEAVVADGLHLRGPGPELMAGFVADQVEQAELEQTEAFQQYLAGVARQQRAKAEATLAAAVARDKARKALLEAQAKAQAAARAKAERDAAAKAAAKAKAEAEAAAARARAQATTTTFASVEPPPIPRPTSEGAQAGGYLLAFVLVAIGLVCFAGALLLVLRVRRLRRSSMPIRVPLVPVAPPTPATPSTPAADTEAEPPTGEAPGEAPDA